MKVAKKINKQFIEVLDLIRRARNTAIRSVNAEHIKLYWQIGEYISKKLKTAEWGESVVDSLADHIQSKHPEFKGFTRRGLYRMRQFYETYPQKSIVSTVLTQLSWSNHLHILAKTKTPAEKEFYLHLSIKEKYSARELERQIDSGYYERVILSKKKIPTPVTQKHPQAVDVFKDSYMLDFLDLPKTYSEKDLNQSIVSNLKDFILEFGKDFTFVGQEYRIQVGGHDYYIDLLFFHRGLRCLVMVELKTDDFKPEHIGKLNFYLEALDRDLKKPDENPSVGIVLCKSKDNEVAEYTLSRNLSPALIAEYRTKLIPKKLLEKKLREYALISQDRKQK